MRYHGNYCGPNWSAGKHQESVIDNNVPAVDEFDQTCLEHDAKYAQYRDDTYEGEVDLDEADEEFYRQNYGKSFKRTVAAIAVNMARRGGRKKPSKKRIAKTVKKEVKKMVPKVRRMAKPRRSGMVVGLARKRPQGRQKGMRIRSKGGDVVILSGRDFYSAVSVTSTQAQGDTLLSIDMNPNSFTNSRLAIFAKLYEKWQIIDFRVEYKASCAVDTSGALVHYFHPDYYDSPGVGSQAINVASSSSNFREMQVWQNSILGYRPERKMPDMYTSENGTDNRLASYGHYYLLAATNFSVANPIGNVFVHYKIRFMKPINETTSATTLAEYTGNSPSTSDYIGSSISQVSGSYGSFITKGGTNSINFQQTGTYFVIFVFNATFASNGGGIVISSGSSVSYSQETDVLCATTTTSTIMKCKIVCTAIGQYLTLSYTTFAPSSVSSCKIYITPAFTGMTKPESPQDIQNLRISELETQIKQLMKLKIAEKERMIEEEYNPRRPGHSSRSQSPTRRFP